MCIRDRFLIVGLPRKDVILILGEPETVVDGPEATVPGVEEHQPHVTVPATCADLNVIHFPERADLPPRSKQEQFLGQFGVNLKPVHRFGHVLSLHRSGSYADMLDSHTRPCCLQVPYTSSGISGSPLSSTCLLYTSDAAYERSSVDLGGRRIIKKKKKHGPTPLRTNQLIPHTPIQ